jgi:hypothetical protein
VFGVRADFGPTDEPLKATVELHVSLGDERLSDGLFTPSTDRLDLEVQQFLNADANPGFDIASIFDPSVDLPEGFPADDQLAEFVVRDTFEASSTELSVGFLFKPTSGNRKWNWFVGGGLSHVTVEAEAMVLEQASPNSIERVLRSRTDEERSSGLFLQGGVAWRIAKRFSLGFALRVLAETNFEFEGLNGLSGDADYTQTGLVFGYDW